MHAYGVVRGPAEVVGIAEFGAAVALGVADQVGNVVDVGVVVTVTGVVRDEDGGAVAPGASVLPVCPAPVLPVGSALVLPVEAAFGKAVPVPITGNSGPPLGGGIALGSGWWGWGGVGFVLVLEEVGGGQGGVGGALLDACLAGACGGGPDGGFPA
ncbi:hypothetical protein ACFWGT_19790, partial [Nocardiopsis sp. NPDC060348]|uniref:hypothetical protein n=1 Tax=Nocardiopsis sp. NPDC060348 TaxID=3347102 RepID=UPI0036526F9E